MRIIPKIFIAAMVASTGYMAQAQDDPSMNNTTNGFYLRVGGGYAFESGKTEFNNADPNGLTGIMQSTDVTVNADGSSVNVKSLNGTVGAGIKLNLTAGYMFSPYIGAEMGFSYFHGDETMIGRLRSPEVTSEENIYLRGVDLAPAIFLTPNFKKFNPYTRIGLIIPVAGQLNIETMARQVNGGGQGTDLMIEAKSEVKSRFSVGYFGALGVTYPINDKLSLFGEIEIKNLSIESKTAEITEYRTTAITNGQSQLVPGQQLADLPVYEKKFEFTDDFDQSTTTPPNQDAARKIPTQFVNASGTGINVGIRYLF
ncbi:outer membrane beta-barrel protein [Subsaximicrobium wynnwilliamsii]|uniref:Outer membrane beta-barrel protein n=1 Tax=Subsaximicrobium wynnwilliamsii TaxID=291179 RepID=A0A5C6ZA95_9FLAO|nr:outer membrane beta-barrel protein [Subsaximicrobium wynnwilliamsii]TXD81155.1 outer membrane beta-barrel protein [Subsaximicrobium wynnwilliamsii]TXD86820.1 outer membrane beta-barrel protein [Subsaximicrobium wynnwilliamsii]TXE00428.1 outer membrane beta-barrel protein [Subsaximicrobium wynnwilliamsii]